MFALQGHDQSNDTKHGVCRVPWERREPTHSGTTKHMASPTSGREVQAAGDEENGGANKQRNGSDEENHKVLQKALHFNL